MCAVVGGRSGASGHHSRSPSKHHQRRSKRLRTDSSLAAEERMLLDELERLKHASYKQTHFSSDYSTHQQDSDQIQTSVVPCHEFPVTCPPASGPYLPKLTLVPPAFIPNQPPPLPVSVPQPSVPVQVCTGKPKEPRSVMKLAFFRDLHEIYDKWKSCEQKLDIFTAEEVSQSKDNASQKAELICPTDAVRSKLDQKADMSVTQTVSPIVTSSATTSSHDLTTVTDIVVCNASHVSASTNLSFHSGRSVSDNSSLTPVSRPVPRLFAPVPSCLPPSIPTKHLPPFMPAPQPSIPVRVSLWLVNPPLRGLPPGRHFPFPSGEPQLPRHRRFLPSPSRKQLNPPQFAVPPGQRVLFSSPNATLPDQPRPIPSSSPTRPTWFPGQPPGQVCSILNGPRSVFDVGFFCPEMRESYNECSLHKQQLITPISDSSSNKLVCLKNAVRSKQDEKADKSVTQTVSPIVTSSATSSSHDSTTVTDIVVCNASAVSASFQSGRAVVSGDLALTPVSRPASLSTPVPSCLPPSIPTQPTPFPGPPAGKVCCKPKAPCSMLDLGFPVNLHQNYDKGKSCQQKSNIFTAEEVSQSKDSASQKLELVCPTDAVSSKLDQKGDVIVTPVDSPIVIDSSNVSTAVMDIVTTSSVVSPSGSDRSLTGDETIRQHRKHTVNSLPSESASAATKRSVQSSAIPCCVDEGTSRQKDPVSDITVNASSTSGLSTAEESNVSKGSAAGKSYACPNCDYVTKYYIAIQRHCIRLHTAKWQGDGQPLRVPSYDQIAAVLENRRNLQQNSHQHRKHAACDHSASSLATEQTLKSDGESSIFPCHTDEKQALVAHGCDVTTESSSVNSTTCFTNDTVDSVKTSSPTSEYSACPDCGFVSDSCVDIGLHCIRYHAAAVLRQRDHERSALTGDSNAVATDHRKSPENMASTVVTDAKITEAKSATSSAPASAKKSKKAKAQVTASAVCDTPSIR